jgi:O-antigen/teichoic acid export membrane protein
VAAAMVGLVHGNTVNVLSMGGHHRHVALSIFVGQIINLALSLLFIHPWGIVGVSLATLIASIPTYVVSIEMYAGRLQGRSLWHFYRATVVPSLIPVLVMTGLFFAIRRFWNLTTLVDVAILECLGIAAFAGVYWITGFDAKERTYFSGKVLKVLRGSKAHSNNSQRVPKEEEPLP